MKSVCIYIIHNFQEKYPKINGAKNIKKLDEVEASPLNESKKREMGSIFCIHYTVYGIQHKIHNKKSPIGEFFVV